MTTSSTTAQPRRSPSTAVHDWLGQSSLLRGSGVDWLARHARSTDVRTIADRVEPSLARPTTRRLVSVVIPCYNYARFLDDSVGSALGQVDVDVEVIVVNDASTDDSAAKADSLAAADPRVVVLHNEQNLGHVRTFNRGHEAARGEFIVRLDADDLLAPGSLSRAVALFEAHPGVGLVYGHPRHFTSHGVPAPRGGAPTWTVWSGHEWIRERCGQGVNCITTPEAVIRASVMREVGALNLNLRFAQDMEMWLRAAAVCDVGHVNDVDQALHRDHDSSMSVNEGAGLMTDLVERRTVFAEVFRLTGEHFADRAALEERYQRTLAVEALRHAQYSLDRGRHQTQLVEDLLGFATETYADASTLEEWADVTGRTGAPSRRDPRGLARVARTRLRTELDYLFWTRTGI